MPGGQTTFGRPQRLSRGRDFQRVLKEGKALRGEYLLVKAFPNGRKGSRFACSVRKSVAASSVSRNRFKRWLRESYRLNQPKMPGGYDWLVIGIKPSENVMYHIVNKELTNLCSELLKRFF